MKQNSTMSTATIAVKIKPKAEKMVKRGHPWIFEKSILKQNKTGKAGDIVVVFDNQKNKFLACGLYDPYSPIRIKLLQFGTSQKIDKLWFSNRIQNVLHIRKPLLNTDTNSYRAIFGENDGLPGCIADVYAHVLVIKLYSHIWFPYLHLIVEVLLKTTKCKVVVLRFSRLLTSVGNTFGLKDGEVIQGNLEDPIVIFKEHGLLFSAHVIKGHKTGYFLDHRHNRKKVGELSKNKSVLDVFSYAGGFSVHALYHGASKVVSIDVSAKALEMAINNAALNTYTGKHEVMAIDAFEGLQKLINQQEAFDIVVIDPPSFAKSEREVSKAKLSYARLVQLGVQLVKPEGVLVFASCSSRITSLEFFNIVEKNIIESGRKMELLTKTYHDIDHPITFPEGAYLKCGYYRLF